MAKVTAIADAVLATLKATLPDVDYASSTSYLPAIKSAKVALMGVAQGHADQAHVYSHGWIHGVHRLRFAFWVKIAQGDAVSQSRARDIGWDAMRALVANDGNGYTLATTGTGEQMTSDVEPMPISEGGQAYYVVNLYVPVMQKEVV